MENVQSNGLIENGNIPVYDFTIRIKNEDYNNPLTISVSKKGGHIVVANHNRNITEEKIQIDEANEIGKNFLYNLGIPDMKPTYYLKQGGAVTINYAYLQDNVTIYPDLIKVKIALDNGEVLGMETTGYLNNHTQRTIETPSISLEEAKASGATGLFENKYGDRVKVYTIGDFSKEICGGPHVKHTGELGHFKIKKEESSSAGVRRIKAILE